MVAIALTDQTRRFPPRPAVAGRRTLPPSTYRRRQATVLGAVAAIAIVAATWLGRLGGGPLTAPEPSIDTVPIARTTYVVQPGDTLWGIARRMQPTGDVRWLVDRLVARRGGAPLQAGEQLTLP